jgi:hypothetical protein
MAINISKEKWNRYIRFIEIWYNRKRRHSTLDYKTIEEFWKQKNNFKMLLTNTAFICISKQFIYPTNLG